MKARLAETLLCLVTILLMAALFEVYCRIVVDDGHEYHIEMWKYAVQLKRVAADPEMGHEHVTGGRARLMRVDVAINGQGLRNREIDAKPPGTKRILMLGDSIAFGWGVAQDATMSALLERRLNDTAFGPVEVVNSGVGNYNTAMEAAYFFDHGAALAPDVVVLNYFINDAEPTPRYRDVPWLARHAFAYPVLGGAWDSIQRRLLGGADWRTYYAGLYDERAPGWLQAQASIVRLAEYCRGHGIRLVLANIPELHILADYPFKTVNTRLAALAAANGIEYLDLLPAVRGERPETLWVTAPDPHPNARAHALMGTALADYLLATPAP